VDISYILEQSTDLLSWTDALGAPPVLSIHDAVSVGTPGTLERVTYRTTDPIDAAPRYVRIRIQLKP
jgi:hypothetical protein